MLEGLRWPHIKLPVGKAEPFEHPAEPPQPQPSMEQGGPPHKRKTALAYFDDDAFESSLRRFFSYRESSKWQLVTQSASNWLRGSDRFLSDIKRNKIII